MNRIVTAVTLILLSYVYAWLAPMLSSPDLAPWQAMATLNTLLALITLLAWRPKHHNCAPQAHQALAWSLGPVVFILALAAIWLAPGLEPGAANVKSPYSILDIIGLCLWVPIIEELIFRRFLTQLLGHRFEGMALLYMSGMLFAIAHTAPPLYPWPPLGPFLLGCAAAWSYRVSRNILAPILLHAACNATAILFVNFAPTWLEHLSWLYQKL